MIRQIFKLVAAVVASSVLATASAVAQVTPVYSVPTPEASGIGTYGSVPVGLFTGVPEISVPLHEMTVGSMSLPISLSYHLSSVKPNVYPGIVGLGWTLQCGGCITRTVRGVPDEKMTGAYENGYYGSHSRMTGITNAEFDILNRDFANTETPDWFELSADEFSFSFFGHHGNFYLSPEGEWVVVSDEDIKVEFDPSSGFVEARSLVGRIPEISRWLYSDSHSSRHFEYFTLVTPDGCRFVFGGVYATDFSVPYYSRKSGDLVATSWYLSRIETPDGRLITYNYEQNSCDLMVDIRYSPSTKRVDGFYADGDNGSNTGRRGFTGFLLYPARLNSIVTPNETIGFEYKADWRYADTYSDGYTGGALYWSAPGSTRTALYQQFDSPEVQFTYLIPSFSGSTDPEIRRNIAGLFKASVLYGIRINKPGDGDTTVLFEYLEESRRKLRRVAWRTGLVNIATRYTNGCGVMYPFYSIPEETSSLDMPEYRFVYDPNHMPKGYVLPQADRWGYWNGLRHSLATTYIGEVPRNVVATRGETLTEIIYPTGGRTVFEYESHTYSKQELPNHGLSETFGVSGGLRVRSITSLSREDDVISSKVYHYREPDSTLGQSSGIARMEDPTTVTYSTQMRTYQYDPTRRRKFQLDPVEVRMSITSMYGFGNPVTNLNSPDVGYSCVVEETLDQDGNSLGYVVNRFSNYGTDINGFAHYDEPASYSYNHVAYGAGIPYTSHSSERGRLLSRSWHRADGTEVRSESYRYTRVNDHPMKTATQRTIYLNSNPEFVTGATVAWLTYTNTYSYMLESVTTREGEYSDSTWRSYNQSRQVVSESVSSSERGQRTTTLSYPSDHPEEYSWMIDAHIISPVITSDTACDGMLRHTENTYSRTESQYNGPVAYVSKVETRYGAEGPQRTDYEVLSADEWGNPTEIVEKGVHSVLLWCRNGQRLMARVEGMTMAEYESLPSSVQSVQSTPPIIVPFPSVPDPTLHSLPGCMVWSYGYDSSLRVVRMTSPDGISKCYGYDALGRLSEEYLLESSSGGEPERKTVKQYFYHYQND